MNEEAGLLNAIRANPEDDTSRLVYADWLDDREDPRGHFVRLHLALRAASPDHVDRVAAEHELSEFRAACRPDWLAVVESERPQPGSDPAERRGCGCFDAGYENRRWPLPHFHLDNQDTECGPWKRLLDLVEEAAADGREEFAPLQGMELAERAQVVTLPQTIAKLKAVKVLNLYGSYLVRIPPEIGEMTGLAEFVPYTSYRLHWLPYELTRCANLRDSTVSTRALYGNYKYRPPFPRLHSDADVAPGRTELARLPLRRATASPTRPCSVCGRPFEDRRRHRVWVSLPVATDVLPLLVNACSDECVAKLSQPPEGYVSAPHRGGLRVQQPSPH